MAFTSAVVETGYEGNKRVVRGTFTNTGGSTGGDIATGLRKVDSMRLQHGGASVVASAPVVNETLPLSGGDVTIVTVADTTGYYEAVGV